MESIQYSLIMVAAFFAIASPGPATLAIAGASMQQGRLYGLSLACGVLSGSLFWSFSAAFGLGAIMYANAWLFDLVRYAGAGYLLYLAYKSTRSAFSGKDLSLRGLATSSLLANYRKGLAIHLTNPKAILFFGSLYSIGLPQGVDTSALLSVIAAVALESATVFLGYAWLFSSPSVRAFYVKSRRAMDAAFALVFGAAGLKILLSRISV